MHRLFREALANAEGRSEFVIVVVADIRGFSAFSKQRESPDTAMYIKRVYTKLMDEYFPNASFYKPTGDGLLVTIPYNEQNFPEVANRTVEACLTCLEQFPSICADNHMINFPTPSAIAFGVARGTACCLFSDDTVLDYSGHLLNLTSRLMDLARPSGVVLDGNFGIELLKPETRGLFGDAQVYVRSLAEEAPIKVYFLKGHVQISGEVTSPLKRETWETWKETRKIREWERYRPIFGLELPAPPKRPDAVVVTVRHPLYQKRKRVKGVVHTFIYLDWEYAVVGRRPKLRIKMDNLLDSVRQGGLPTTAPMALEVHYVPAPK